MANPFSFLKQRVFPNYLGVDIGTTSIKVVEVGSGKDRPRIVNYGLLEANSYLAHANKALQTSTLKLFEEEIIDLLRSLLKEMKPGTTNAIASLPVFSAFMTILDLPDMKPFEVQKTMEFQAPQYIPLPITEVGYDWMKVGEFKDDKGFVHQQVLLISVPKEQIKRYQEICTAAGLHLRALELESLSLVRILIGADPTPTLIIDIGSRSTNISFAEQGQLKFSSQSDFAGASLTQALSSSLQVNPLRAEELKKERGIVNTEGANYELSTVMLPFLDAILNEVKKARFHYENQFPMAPKAERAIISGGGANLLGIEKYFQGILEIPVVKASPFLRFEYPPQLAPFVSELNPFFSVALGLALREYT